MGKMTVYMLIMGGLILLFYFMGLVQTDEGFLGYLLHPETLKAADITDQAIVAISAIGISTALIYGFFTRQTELVAMAGFTVVLATLGWQFINVFNYIRSQNEFIAIIIFGPIFIVWVLTLIEFWRGRD